MKILEEEFFQRKAPKVAQDLLGKFIVRKIGKLEIALMINEVEAYLGFEDKASHASRGLTERNKVMFEAGGCFYVYLLYGLHYMINVVTENKGQPSAVLIRGAGEISGPGRLSKYLQVDSRLNNKMAGTKTKMWFEDRGIKIFPKDFDKTPRIGVDYAGDWSQKPYRFVLK